jgi:hypothetical protein
MNYSVLDFAGFLGKFLLFGDSCFFVNMWVVSPFGSDLIFKVFEEVARIISCDQI